MRERVSRYSLTVGAFLRGHVTSHNHFSRHQIDYLTYVFPLRSKSLLKRVSIVAY